MADTEHLAPSERCALEILNEQSEPIQPKDWIPIFCSRGGYTKGTFYSLTLPKLIEKKAVEIKKVTGRVFEYTISEEGKLLLLGELRKVKDVLGKKTITDDEIEQLIKKIKKDKEHEELWAQTLAALVRNGKWTNKNVRNFFTEGNELLRSANNNGSKKILLQAIYDIMPSFLSCETTEIVTWFNGKFVPVLTSKIPASDIDEDVRIVIFKIIEKVTPHLNTTSVRKILVHVKEYLEILNADVAELQSKNKPIHDLVFGGRSYPYVIPVLQNLMVSLSEKSFIREVTELVTLISENDNPIMEQIREQGWQEFWNERVE